MEISPRAISQVKVTFCLILLLHEFCQSHLQDAVVNNDDDIVRQNGIVVDENYEDCERDKGSTKEDNKRMCGGGVLEKNFGNKYILYDVHPGEGFNLRRDVYIRIAQLVRSLNALNHGETTWTLVLPPWQGLPHWRTTDPSETFSWSRFFRLENIQKYVPVMEWEDFLEDMGMAQGLATLYSLKHFPFQDGEEWKEEVKVGEGQECENQVHHYEIEGSRFTTLWGSKIPLGEVKCLSLRGHGLTLLPIVEEEPKSHRSIMFLNAEVILWDDYGGVEWWRGRASLKFALHLEQVARQFLEEETNLKELGDPYIALHLRRRDFLKKKDAPTLEQVAEQISRKSKTLNVTKMFLASDGDPQERTDLSLLLLSRNPQIHLFFFPCNHPLSEGECAIIDQILCSWSTFFLGSEESTFTFRIFEERMLLGKDPDSTFNYICTNEDKKPSRFLIPESIRDELVVPNK